MSKDKVVHALGAVVACFVLVMLVTPSIPQPQKYHDFADKRTFFGIPHALNVISNLPLLIIGLVGLTLCHHQNYYFNFRLQGEIWGWTCFYFGVAASGLGSAYYHLNPNDARLAWDRWPMAVTFASLVATLITERIDEKKGIISIAPLNIGAISAVVFFDDIRLYGMFQFASCIAIPLMAYLLPPTYTHSSFWLLASGFYPLAMVQESTDRVIYMLTQHIVSGHTLKHLSAAMVPVITTFMLAKRRPLHAKSV
ncbi:hypothetical protein PIB30_010326 [Stylosanthes scabra]|uniref:Ceramidase n=1 Tax=Stylosanthes scabra TaxID=79078 RepID=A0ABU6V653_9FABA|nr:hypothetical protein [Stylosanthes scabra]